MLRSLSSVVPTQRNGCGKSTFLRILAESCDGTSFAGDRLRDNVPYTGDVNCPKDVSVAYVEQEPPSPSDVTVSDALLGVTRIDEASTVISGGINRIYEVRISLVSVAAQRFM